VRVWLNQEYCRQVKILVVEDEPRAVEYLRQGLSEHGFTVATALTSVDGLHAAVTGDHNLILLDVMLPGIYGFAVLSAIRSAKQTPVLMLTARANTDDKVKGFDLGADDYLAKPFSFPELLARVRALLKRGAQSPLDPVLSIADLQVDLLSHRVIRSGIQISLTPREFSLLVLMIRRRGEILSRTQIASLVWDMNFDSDTNVVDVAVRRLRSKIEDSFEGVAGHHVQHHCHGRGESPDPIHQHGVRRLAHCGPLGTPGSRFQCRCLE